MDDITQDVQTELHQVKLMLDNANNKTFVQKYGALILTLSLASIAVITGYAVMQSDVDVLKKASVKYVTKEHLQLEIKSLNQESKILAQKHESDILNVNKTLNRIDSKMDVNHGLILQILRDKAQ